MTMTFIETMKWMFPSWHVLFFGLFLTTGSFLVSWRLNSQTWSNKRRNTINTALALFGAAMWFSTNRIMHHEPYVFRSFALLTAVFIYYTAGDWLAFWIHHLVIWSEIKSQKKAMEHLALARATSSSVPVVAGTQTAVAVTSTATVIAVTPPAELPSDATKSEDGGGDTDEPKAG